MKSERQSTKSDSIYILYHSPGVRFSVFALRFFCSHRHAGPAGAGRVERRQAEDLPAEGDVVAVVRQRRAVGDAVIEAKGAAGAQRRDEFVFELATDGGAVLAEHVL